MRLVYYREQLCLNHHYRHRQASLSCPRLSRSDIFRHSAGTKSQKIPGKYRFRKVTSDLRKSDCGVIARILRQHDLVSKSSTGCRKTVSEAIQICGRGCGRVRGLRARSTGMKRKRLAWASSSCTTSRLLSTTIARALQLPGASLRRSPCTHQTISVRSLLSRRGRHRCDSDGCSHGARSS